MSQEDTFLSLLVYSGFLGVFSLETAACCGPKQHNESSENNLKQKAILYRFITLFTFISHHILKISNTVGLGKNRKAVC